MKKKQIQTAEIEIEETMKKNLQNQIEIPMNVEDKMQDAYRQIYQGTVKMKPAAKKRLPMWTKAAAAAVCVGFAGSALLVSNPALARDLPLIGNIFDEMMKARDAEPYGKKDTTAYQNIKENAQQILTEQMAAIDQGIKLEVTDAYCDGYDLYFTLGAQDENGALEAADGIQFFKNQSLLEVIKIDGTYIGSNVNMKYIGDGTYAGILNINKASLPAKTFAEKFFVELNIDTIESAYYGDSSKVPKAITGEWNLSFEVTKDESKNQVFDLQAKAQGFAVEKIVQTPSNLHLDFIIPKEWTEQNPDIQVIDEQGNAMQKWSAISEKRADGSELREYSLEYSGSRNYIIRVVDKNNSSQDELSIIAEIPITL